MTPEVQIAIVGGGPVGLVAALFAADAGLEPVVIEPRETPIDKACGEGLGVARRRVPPGERSR